jgi:hypothetical protein
MLAGGCSAEFAAITLIYKLCDDGLVMELRI